MKRRTARLLSLAAGLVVALALAELLVRALGLAPEVAFLEAGRFRLSDNPRIGYEPIATGSTNSLGFRDREREVAAAADVFRAA